MQATRDLWYQVGYALEKARRHLPSPPESRTEAVSRSSDASRKLLSAFLTVGTGTLITRLLTIWPGRRRAGPLRLLRGGAAGAAAAVLSSLLHPLLAGEDGAPALEEELADVLLAGIGRGLVYAALVEPRLPGPAALRGTVYGALEYLLAPWGGLGEVAGPAAPQGKVPVLSVLLKNREAEEAFIEHIAFGVALALLAEG